MKLALIGMMGTMKSAVGKELAAMLKLPLMDTDEIFVSRSGMSINDAFASCGEHYFRAVESQILAELAIRDGIIISCGGGVPLQKANAEFLQACIVVRLTATPQTIFSRLRGDRSRPLLKDMSLARIAGLIDERESAYEAAANFTLATDDRLPTQVAAEICGLLK